jgi:uncharacterized membrane protein
MKRLWLLDFLRGLAVLMMIVFHSLMYIDYFGLARIGLYSGFIGRFQMIIPMLFLGVSGASAYIQLKGKGKRAVMIKGLKLSFWALLVTLGTWMLFPKDYVFFGILHLISFCTFFAIIVTNSWVGGGLGLAILSIQNIIMSFAVNNKYLSILGFNYSLLSTWDYYPIIPWAGVFFLGFFLGRFLIKWKAKELGNRFAKIICLMGRHALKIYLIHIPALFGFFWALSIYL